MLTEIAKTNQMESPPLAGSGDASPKQVAMAMDRLDHAARLIADIRLGADRILEALLVSNETQRLSEKAAELVLAEDAAMKRHFVDLHAVGIFSTFLHYHTLISSVCNFRLFF
jgi:mediator of RNA polymerase II transcription subunit 27